jgi:hypothetical protein
MAEVCVYSGGSNTSPYATWATAAIDLKTATDYVNGLGAGAHNIYKHQEWDVITVDTIYTLPAGTQVFLTNDLVNEPPQTMGSGASGGVDGSATAGVDITLAGYGVRWRNFGFKPGSGGVFWQATTAGANLVTTENCKIYGHSGTSSFFAVITSTAQARNHGVCLKNEFIFNSVTQYILINSSEILDCYVSGTVTPNRFFVNFGADDICLIKGGDYSALAATAFIGGDTPAINAVTTIENVRKNASTVWRALPVGQGNTVFIIDSSDADIHYDFAHYHYLGNTLATTAIYANDTDGATYDGTNKYSFAVTGVNATPASPYLSPWISRFVKPADVGVAITPKLEILRDGSTTPYTDAEVFSDWLVNTSTGFTNSTFYSDQKSPLVAAANQTAGIGLASWTGEGANAWSGQLDVGSKTPAEIGYIQARIGVTGAFTVYVDPWIRW